jgi:TPR repeat protein
MSQKYVPNEYKSLFNNDIVCQVDVPSFQARLSEAKAGNTGAAVAVAGMYEKGRGTPRNAQKAFHYYEMAAEKGDRYAQFRVARAYLRGEGVPKNLQKAMQWAAEAMKDATSMMARIIYAAAVLESPGSDVAGAIRLVQPFAEPPVSNGCAQFWLGKLYGKLATPNKELSRRWLEESHRAGFTSAAVSLANILLRSSEFDAALTIYQQAADRNDDVACLNLYCFYQRIVKRIKIPERYGNPGLAHTFLVKAAELGNAMAMIRLGLELFRRVREDDLPGVRNQAFVAAAKWFKRANELGKPLGAMNYGKMCIEGKAGPVDVRLGIEMLISAARGGIWQACFALAELLSDGKHGLPTRLDLAQQLRMRGEQLKSRERSHPGE